MGITSVSFVFTSQIVSAEWILSVVFKTEAARGISADECVCLHRELQLAPVGIGAWTGELVLVLLEWHLVKKKKHAVFVWKPNKASVCLFVSVAACTPSFVCISISVDICMHEYVMTVYVCTRQTYRAVDPVLTSSYVSVQLYVCACIQF